MGKGVLVGLGEVERHGDTAAARPAAAPRASRRAVHAEECRDRGRGAAGAAAERRSHIPAGTGRIPRPGSPGPRAARTRRRLPRATPRISLKASLRFRPAMTAATSHERIWTDFPMRYWPIHLRSETRWTRGITAKVNCRERTTWDRTSRSPTERSPAIRIVSAAGTIATARVSRRRTCGRSRTLRNPSITIWPARVPVMVEDWPAAIRAIAKADGRDRGAEDRLEQLVRVLDLGDIVCGRCE